MLGSRINQAPVVHGDENLCWPLNGANEIDIFEAATNTNTNQGNFIKNWGAGCEVYDGRNFVTPYSESPFGYNTYRVEWGADNNLRLFVNGVVKRTLAPSEWQGVWDCPYFNILNCALGGSLGGAVNFGPGDWAGITVDYVKHEYLQ
jgi:beta-glucanase (GH16 family)